MFDAVTVSGERTVGDVFVAIVRLWLAQPSSSLLVAVLAIAFGFPLHGEAPLWLAVLGAIAWASIMVLFFLALQTWKITSQARAMGALVYTFDEQGVRCQHGSMVTSVPWSGIVRVKLTDRTCFLYVSPSVMWVFPRRHLTSDQASCLCALARNARVRLEGATP